MAKRAPTSTKSNAAAAAPAPISDTVAATAATAAAQAEAAQASASKADTNQAEGVQARQADADVKRSYLVGTVPINHDGRLYGVGYEIQLTESEAYRLSGLVIPFPEQG